MEADPVRLHYEERGSGAPVVILHGLFGSLSNWRSVARYLSESYRVLSVDLRNHGRSPHARPHSYAAMVCDVVRFFDEHELSSPVVVGHSMGGRVAMHLALTHPGRVAGLCVLDVLPTGGPKSEIGNVLELMKSFDPAECSSRREAGTRLSEQIADEALASSILMNVGRARDGKLFWRLGVEEIAADFDGLSEPAPQSVYGGACLFVRGGASSYFPAERESEVRARFSSARVECLEGAGHLLHIDRPDALRGLLAEFLRGFD